MKTTKIVALTAALLASTLCSGCLLVNPFGSSVDEAPPPLASFTVQVVKGASDEDVAMVEQAAEGWKAMASGEISISVSSGAEDHPAKPGEIVVVFRPTGVQAPEGYYLGDCVWGSTSPGESTSVWADAWVADDLEGGDKLNIVFHELGHALGLFHSLGPAASVMKTFGSEGVNSYVPTCADAAELCRLWGCKPVCSTGGF